MGFYKYVNFWFKKFSDIIENNKRILKSDFIDFQ